MNADATLPYEMALSELIDKIVPGLDSGDILADARTALSAPLVPDGWTLIQIDKATRCARQEQAEARLSKATELLKAVVAAGPIYDYPVEEVRAFLSQDSQT